MSRGHGVSGAAMLVNGATKSFVSENRRPDRKLPSDRSAHIDHNLVETAAEALYEFVFSGCDRLDGKHRWADCDEETKVGFRREASAVLEAVLPVLLLREIKSSQIERTANWSRASTAFRPAQHHKRSDASSKPRIS